MKGPELSRGSTSFSVTVSEYVSFQVLKSYRKKKRRGKKSVEKCLYGKRDIASKKPLLSPIPELPEVSEMTALADCTQRTCSGASLSLIYFLSPPPCALSYLFPFTFI